MAITAACTEKKNSKHRTLRLYKVKDVHYTFKHGNPPGQTEAAFQEGLEESCEPCLFPNTQSHSSAYNPYLESWGKHSVRDFAGSIEHLLWKCSPIINYHVNTIRR